MHPLLKIAEVTSFHHRRIRSLHHAGRPNWNLLTTGNPRWDLLVKIKSR